MGNFILGKSLHFFICYFTSVEVSFILDGIQYTGRIWRPCDPQVWVHASHRSAVHLKSQANGLHRRRLPFGRLERGPQNFLRILRPDDLSTQLLQN